MSHSTSPTKSSLFGWVNKLKRNSTSVDELLLDDPHQQGRQLYLLPDRTQPTGGAGASVSSSPRGTSQDLQPQMSPLSYTNSQRPIPQPIPISSSNSNHHRAVSPAPLTSPMHQHSLPVTNSISNVSVASSPNQIAAGTLPMVSSPSHLTLSHHSDFLRPLLHHKSRSSNNVHPNQAPYGSSLTSARDRARSNSNVSLKQNIDSFVAQNYRDENSKYFGVPLEDAIAQAAAKISILAGAGSGAETDASGVQYGKIPIVVAKCGVFLKKKGLTVEGIFRVGGSSKRIKELQQIFNTPPDFGKKLSWEGYNVHDAASILRRYLNALPEPLIPLAFYEQFRTPLLDRPRVINYLKFKAENPKKSSSAAATAISGSAAGTSATAGSSSDFAHGAALLTPSNKATAANKRASISSENDPRLEKALENEVIESMIPKSPHLTSITSKESPVLSSLDQVASSSNAVLGSSRAIDRSTVSTPDSADSKASAGKDEVTTTKEKHHKRKYKKLTKDVHDAIDDYTHMVEQLPILSKQLLFYILDLLAMVQNHSAENRMPSRNLAAIFQPSILSHPDHDMDPEEYALSQYVVEFLIQYAYRLLPHEEQKKESPRRAVASLPHDSRNVAQATQLSTIEDAPSLTLTTVASEVSGPKTEVTTPPRKPKAPTSEIPKTPSSGHYEKAAVPTSGVSSSSPTTLEKPVPKFRSHSKSLPLNSNDEDLVVYQTPSTLPSKNNVIDSDIGMTDDSSEDEAEGDNSSPKKEEEEATQKLADFSLSNTEANDQQTDNEFDFGSSSNVADSSATAVSHEAATSASSNLPEATKEETSAHPSPQLGEEDDENVEIEEIADLSNKPPQVGPKATDTITPPKSPMLNGDDTGNSVSPKIVVSEVPPLA